MHDEFQVPIWFFIGALLLVYGVLITGAGLFALASPPPEAERVALYHLHADVWWGILMTVMGLFYTLKFHPFGREKS